MPNQLMKLFAMAALLATPALAQERGEKGETITLTLGGDMIGPVHPMNRATDADFARVADLFRTADAGFVNQENNVFDMQGFAGFPAAETGGGHPLRFAAHARELKDMGATLVSLANNHATDFGAEGLARTLGNLADAGVAAAGAGLNEQAARAPAYRVTPRGTVALVATASTFTPSAVAGSAVERHGVMSKARPGIAPLHVRKVRIVPPALYRAVQDAAGPLAQREGTALRIGDQLFREGAAAETRWEMLDADRNALFASVAEADKRADLVLFSIHAHETAGDEAGHAIPFHPTVLQHANEAPSPNDPRPASFQVELFRALIDRGADAVARHGPHVISGIEIYKGKPIFYGLGSLFLDFGGLREFDTPSGEKIVVPDSWFDSFVPVSQFSGGKLRKITLYPVAINPDAGDRSGSPALATGARATAILTQLKTLSAPFGTRIRIAGDVGIVEVD